eukprot:m.54593 g.54593  ORF g.54593 m.54593 type:complete len:249 (+) comp21938_c0_seq1:250-996(+)
MQSWSCPYDVYGEDIGAVPTDLQAQVESSTQRDYDAEAQKLFLKLNLGPLGEATVGSTKSGRYSNLDPVWKDVKSGGIVYVGNSTAASSLHILREHRITKVVNCTDTLPLYHQSGPRRDLSIEYFRFDLYKLFAKQMRNSTATAAHFQPVFAWIDEAISQGENVLIHCLAGAHRAGCTGVAYVLHVTNLSAKDAIKVCTKARSAIQIFPELEEILVRLADQTTPQPTHEHTKEKKVTVRLIPGQKKPT